MTPVAPLTTSQAYDARLDANRWKAVGGLISDITRNALPLVGLGAGARGLLGIASMLQPKPKQPEEQDNTDLTLPVMKMGSLWDTVSGAAANTPDDVWWGAGAKLMAYPAAVYGGFRAMDSVLDSRRKGLLQTNVDEAKQRFQKALLGATSAKTADERSELGAQLDRLYDLLEQRVKQASNPLGNAFGAVGIPLAALFAMAAYNSARRQQKGPMLDKALELRAQQRQGTVPLQFHVPEPAEVPAG